MSTLIITQDAAKVFAQASRQRPNLVRAYDRMNEEDMSDVAKLINIGIGVNDLSGFQVEGCNATFRLFESTKGFQLRVTNPDDLQEARTFINQK